MNNILCDIDRLMMESGNKEVDVIYAITDDLPIILEVIDTDDIKVTLDRMKFYEDIYFEVRLESGVDFYKKMNKRW